MIVKFLHFASICEARTIGNEQFNYKTTQMLSPRKI